MPRLAEIRWTRLRQTEHEVGEEPESWEAPIVDTAVRLHSTLIKLFNMAATPGVRSESPSLSTQTTLLASDAQTFDNTGYCLLSLDGGGVRGLATLRMLHSIMTRLNNEREDAGLRPRKPCEIFDLIGGTSTGG